jgi:hypothetical protein
MTRNRDRGSVTAELAMAFPVVVLLLLVGLTGISALLAKLRCVDAAREAARTAARGEAGEPAGQRAAPAGATISVRVEGDTVTAVVRVPVRPLVPLLPTFTVEADAVAAVEPGGDGS